MLLARFGVRVWEEELLFGGGSVDTVISSVYHFYLQKTYVANKTIYRNSITYTAVLSVFYFVFDDKLSAYIRDTSPIWQFQFESPIGILFQCDRSCIIDTCYRSYPKRREYGKVA